MLEVQTQRQNFGWAQKVVEEEAGEVEVEAAEAGAGAGAGVEGQKGEEEAKEAGPNLKLVVNQQGVWKLKRFKVEQAKWVGKWED